MKQFGINLILFSVLLFSSCVSTDNTDQFKRNEVLGIWQIDDESVQKHENKALITENRIITKFDLKTDSTATIYYGNKAQEGTWLWKVDLTPVKLRSYVKFSAGDIVLFPNDKEGESSVWGLYLKKSNGTLKSIGGSAESGEIIYRKQ